MNNASYSFASTRFGVNSKNVLKLKNQPCSVHRKRLEHIHSWGSDTPTSELRHNNLGRFSKSALWA